jgi:hypothetical protein
MDNAIKLLQKQKERTADEVFIYRNKTPFTFNRPAGRGHGSPEFIDLLMNILLIISEVLSNELA